ncbi:MAG: phage tail protein [Clostridia bacterium]|nr:phage tail protein [Clostridia bacterium]
MANKVKFGLKNAHYASLTFGEGGTPTFGTPVPIPGSVNLSLSRASEAEDFYADDGIYYEGDDNSELEGELELALIPEDFHTAHLGESKDSNGVLNTPGFVERAPFALLFEFTGDKNAIRHVLYNCTASQNEIAGQTKQQNRQVQTETLNLRARLLPAIGKVKARTGDTTTASVYDNWYDSVYQSPAAPQGSGN